MLRLTRGQTPACLEQNWRAWTDEWVALRTMMKLADGERPIFKWRSRSCYNEMRSALTHWTDERCAYCDGWIGVESRSTIDHFKSKSRFPELAYSWTNLFPCCDNCQQQKPEEHDRGLLKPDHPDYRFERFFICNYASGEVEPAPEASPEDRARAAVTIRALGLNLPARTQARLRELKKFERDPGELLDDYSYRFFLQ